MVTINGITEKDLIVRLNNGDQNAYELLFNFYYSGLVIYSTQFTADRDESEEIVQDFFVRFWQKIQQISPSDSLKNYFFSSIKNSSLNYLKHKKIEAKYLKDLGELSNHHLVYDPDLYIATELQDKIKNAITTLPQKCREIFIMSRNQGLKNEEIAVELTISKRTVETQISNALKVLRVALKDYVRILLLIWLHQF
jgi:RNA polymerase sigma-70 factor, ECF subfamily